MIHQVPIGRASRFLWTPRYLPDPDQQVSVSLTANGQSVDVVLTSKGSVAISGAPDDYRLRASVVATEPQFVAGESFGSWWLHAPGVGQFPVELSGFDDSTNDFILAQPLNVRLPDSFAATLHHNVYAGEIPSGALGAAVDRRGVWRIDWNTHPDFQGAGANFQPGAFTDRGAVRVVRAMFDTGLTASRLVTLVPILAQTRPAGFASWQPLIDTMADAVISEIEHRLPDNGHADMTLGSQWMRAAALLVASHVAESGYAPNVNAEALKMAAHEEFDRQAARVVWLDLNDDGLIGDGETGVDSASLVGIMRSSASQVSEQYESGRRHRFKLDNPDDR